MRISDWSSDVCSSDLARAPRAFGVLGLVVDEQRLRRCCAELPQALQEDRRLRLGQPKLRRTEHAVVEQREQRRADRRQVRWEERLFGKECCSPCRSRWSPAHSNKKHSTSKK